MSTQDDLASLANDVRSERSQVVRDLLEGVLLVGFRGIGLAVTEHVWDDDTQAEREEVGGLVAPAEGEVGPAVNEEDGGGGRGGGVGEKVVPGELLVAYLGLKVW
jgi:hypothetical protein